MSCEELYYAEDDRELACLVKEYLETKGWRVACFDTSASLKTGTCRMAQGCSSAGTSVPAGAVFP